MRARRAALCAPLALVTLFAVAGCSSSDPSTVAASSPSPSSAVTPTSEATAVASGVPSDSVDQTITLVYAAGKVAGGVQRIKVKLGSRLRITVTSDQPDELHVHLDDLKKDLTVNQPASIELVADKPGIFEVELEKLGKTLATLQVS